MSAKWFVLYIEGFYWAGVFTGRLSHVQYTNGNMDTFIHGALFVWGPFLIGNWLHEWKQRRQAKREMEVA